MNKQESVVEERSREDLEQELERAKTDAQETYAMYVRTLADFDNYRKRVDRERNEIGEAGKRDLLISLLDIADNFERLASAAEGQGNLAPGIAAVYRQIQRVLENHGVVPFESVGEQFDPERHEAIGMVPGTDAPEGQIIDQQRGGYTRNGRLLRPARVLVAG